MRRLSVIFLLFSSAVTLFAAAPAPSAQLLAEGKHDAAVAAAEKEILAKPRNWQDLPGPLKVQIRALLAAKRPKEALQRAKALYNLTGMTGTAEAVQLLYECLQAAHHGDSAILERFRSEQEAGAVAPADWTAPGQRSPVIDSIPLDAHQYDEAIKKYADDYDGCLSKGNLLLLCGRASEARPLFEKLYQVAADDKLAGVTENLARCIKAEDGTIGRANAFVLSLRPKREAAKKK